MVKLFYCFIVILFIDFIFMKKINKNKILPRAEIGIFGGSGFYELLENSIEVEAETVFGAPADKIMVGKIAGQRVAFLPRHGRKHSLPPHKIPYKANLWAFKKLGVKRIIAPAAVGSLNPLIKRGDFVICDQFVNWTRAGGSPKRDDTFYHGEAIEGFKNSERVAHFSMADPYCQEMRKIASRAAKKLAIPYHESGTVVVIEGPRFSTRAESNFFTRQGFDIINMTIYPEVVLARELGMCYLNIGLVTDYDVGLLGSKNIRPVSIQEVMKVFKKNNERLKLLLGEIIMGLPKERKCVCEKYVKEAMV